MGRYKVVPSKRFRSPAVAEGGSLILTLILAGCLGSLPPHLTEEADTTSVPSAPGRVSIDAGSSQQTAVGIPCPGAPGNCWAGVWGFAPITLPEPSPLTATLTAEWEPSTPAARTLQVYVYGEGNATFARGTSPLTFDLTPETTANVTDLEVLVGPDFPGAMLQDAVRFRLDLVYAANDTT